MTLSIGIVGAGDITRRAHLPVLMNIPDVTVAWITDHRADRAEALAAAYALQSVRAATPADLPACDVALLAIPVDVRMPYFEHFAARGTAVFSEKPFAMSAADHSKLLEMFPAHALACGYMRRFFRWSVLLRHLVADRSFGPLHSIWIGEGNRSKGSGADASFLDDPRLGASRGVLADLGSHGLDLALHISGADAFEVDTCERVNDGAVDRKVTARIRLFVEQESPRAVDLDFGVSWLDRQINQIRLGFENASLWSDLSPGGSVFVGEPGDSRVGITLQGADDGAATYNQAFYLEWRDFIDSLRAQREPRTSARSAHLTTSMLESLLNFAGART